MLIGMSKYEQMLNQKITDSNSSLILSGSRGIGKYTLMLDILKRHVSNESNLHIINAEEGKSQISVEQIRSLFELLNIMPYGDKKHYVLIDDAEKLNQVSFNLLLKRMEEPKPTEMFILVTSDLDKIAPTIKSRCISINMNIDSSELNKYLMQIEENPIRLALQKLGFSYILKYVSDDTIKSRYEDTFKFINELLSLTSLRKLNEYSTKFISNIDICIELIINMCDYPFVKETYDYIKSGTVNKQSVIDILIYQIVKENVNGDG